MIYKILKDFLDKLPSNNKYNNLKMISAIKRKRKINKRIK